MAESYKVVLVEDWTSLNARNNPVEGYRVSFETPEGYKGFVFIERGQLNTAVADDAIVAESERIQSIYGL